MSNTSPFDGTIIFFGDSLSDPGNLAEQAGTVLPPELVEEIGDDGRASNGPVWTEQLVEQSGADEIYNYAVAGAEAAGSQSIGDFIDEAGLTGSLTVPADDPALDWDMNLSAQIARFEADFAGDDLSSATAVILIGGNDYLALDLTANPIVLLAQAAATLASAVDATIDAVISLAAAGVGHIVVYSMPDFTFFPAFSGLDEDIKAIADTISDLHNEALEDAVDDLATSGISVQFLDLGPLTDALVDDPSSFGILAPYDQTLTEGNPGSVAAYDEDQIAFWDSIHPTEAVHGVLAAFSAYALEDTPVALGAEADSWSGTSDADLTFGYGGSDLLSGLNGDDLLFSGSGDDIVLGDDGNDLISGGSGNDILFGREDDDVLAGGDGDDILGGGRGNDVLIDGLGNDILRGWSGDDTFIWIDAALLGPDTKYGTQTFKGGEGYDTLYLVVETEVAYLYQAAIDAGTAVADLAELGIYVYDIEEIVVIEERSGLDVFSSESWYDDADLWGLI